MTHIRFSNDESFIELILYHDWSAEMNHRFCTMFEIFHIDFIDINKNLMKNLQEQIRIVIGFCLPDCINTFYAPLADFLETRGRSDVDLMSHQWTLRER